MDYLCSNPKFKNILCSEINKKHSKIKRFNPMGYYNVSYPNIILNKSVYDDVNNYVRVFNNKHNKSKYIRGKI